MKEKAVKRFNFVAVAIVFQTLFLMGCGNVFTPRTDKAPSNAFYYQPIQSSALGTDPNSILQNYNCEGATMVYPEADTMGEVPGLSVCTGKASDMKADILIQGEVSGTDMLCAFPVRQSASGAKSWYTDPENRGRPLYKCGQNTVEGTPFSFPTLKTVSGFNAVFVVDQADVADMEACLQANLAFCPYYYYGKFR
jgi:hypothetical protein